jgi:transposase
MYLKKAKVPKGRTYLSIAEGYYDSEKKHTRTINIQKLGYLDVLAKEYDDPIAHFEAIVKKMNAQKSAAQAVVAITLNPSERLTRNTRKNVGYAALSAIYHELEIDHFFTNRQRSIKAEYSMNKIMRLLVFSRLLHPGSKKKAFEEREWFFERSDFTLDDIYRALSRFSYFRDSLQVWIHEHIRKNYRRDTSVIYYDVTNYYFEIDEQDDLRRKGVSKEHRPDPIVQMGLFIDNTGLPIAYQLFPGNNNDCTTLLPIIKKVRREYGIGKAVVVSDKGMNTQKNAYYLANSRGGYVFSQSVRGGTKELKSYVLNENDYEWMGNDYKKKARPFMREVEFEDDDGRSIKAKIPEKQVVFYSRDYDHKAKADRATTIAKAIALIQEPKKYNKYNTYGAAKYIKHIEFDKATGEIIQSKSLLSFNEAALKEDEKLDGYYAIVTSRYNEADDWVIGTYKGLWRIEETFKVTKSDLEARPVYVSREDHIQAHFLICFLALVIIRLLQQKVENNFSTDRIISSLAKTCCSNIQENLFLFDYYDEVIAHIGLVLGIDFTTKFRTRADIKNIIAQTKKL